MRTVDRHRSTTLAAARPRLIAEIVRAVSTRRLSVDDMKAKYPGFDRNILYKLREENRSRELSDLGPVRILAIAEALDIDVRAAMFPEREAA